MLFLIDYEDRKLLGVAIPTSLKIALPLYEYLLKRKTKENNTLQNRMKVEDIIHQRFMGSQANFC